ncbi:hypothetical protein Tco_0122890 [Tanacetum coccineum]
MKQDKAKQAARDESLVPSNSRINIGNARVKIGTNNLRMDPSAKLKEETYQVALDVFKITPFYNAFLISADVSTCSSSGLPSRKKILDISPIVENQEFTVPPSSESLVEFLVDLGYKGEMTQTSHVYVDLMHKPWRTFGAIINKCLSRKIKGNDRLRPSRIAILWGMYHNENVDYVALI